MTKRAIQGGTEEWMFGNSLLYFTGPFRATAQRRTFTVIVFFFFHFVNDVLSFDVFCHVTLEPHSNAL